MKQRTLTIGLILTFYLAACSTDQSQMLPDPGDIEAMPSQFYDDIAAYDYAAMRAVYTPGFEILDDGSRFDADGFEALIRDIEGRGLTWDFELSEFNTDVRPDIAYTSYAMTSPPDYRWYGAATLVRSDAGWSIDRMTMMAQSEGDDGQAADDAESPYAITQISGDLYRFQHGGHFNVFLVTSEGIIMTDPVSEFDDNATDWLKEQFAQRFGVPVRYVIYSHHHLDHAAGGDAFADTAEFVGHENMLDKFEPEAADEPLKGWFGGLDRDGDNRVVLEESGPLASRLEAWDTNQDDYLDNAEITLMAVNRVRRPDTVYADRMTIELGGKTVELIATPPNHSNDMTVVYFPEERVVFGVDTFGAFGGLPTGPFAGSAMTDWIETYRIVEALDFDILAPGHGPMARKADVTLMRMAWEDLHAAVAAGIEAGSSLEELQRTVTLDNYMNYPGYGEVLPVAIAEAHRTILAHQ